MHAYIFKKNKHVEAKKTLQIQDQNIAFFITPVMESASFFTSEDGKKWHLCFFSGSGFEQELFVHFNTSEDDKNWSIARACWMDNDANDESNAGLIEDASLFLRQSRTLSLARARELTTHRMLIADRDGIAYFSNDEDQFKRIILCQSLAIAYTQVLSECMARMTKNVKSNLTEDALVLYENILRFNAAYYFSLPVLLKRHELSAAWQVLCEHYQLKLLNQELTQQLSDVAALLREKREHQQRALLEQAAQTALRQKQKEDRTDKRRTFWLSLIGILLTATSLLSLAQLTPQQFRDNRNAWKTWWNESGTEQLAPTLGTIPAVKKPVVTTTKSNKNP